MGEMILSVGETKVPIRYLPSNRPIIVAHKQVQTLVAVKTKRRNLGKVEIRCVS